MLEISDMTDIKEVELRMHYWRMTLKQRRKEVSPLNEEIERGERELMKLRQRGHMILSEEAEDAE